MKLFRDVLDKQLVDRIDRPCGKVDGVVLVVPEDGTPARLEAITSGATVLARRMGPRFERFVAALARRFGPRGGAVARVPWSKVTDLGIVVKLDVDAETSDLHAGERWARDRVVARIPGA